MDWPESSPCSDNVFVRGGKGESKKSNYIFFEMGWCGPDHLLVQRSLVTEWRFFQIGLAGEWAARIVLYPSEN